MNLFDEIINYWLWFSSHGLSSRCWHWDASAVSRSIDGYVLGLHSRVWSFGTCRSLSPPHQSCDPHQNPKGHLWAYWVHLLTLWDYRADYPFLNSCFDIALRPKERDQSKQIVGAKQFTHINDGQKLTAVCVARDPNHNFPVDEKIRNQYFQQTKSASLF